MTVFHAFSVEAANEVGVNAAILLQSISYWCEKNKANGKHFHDGLTWTYNSVKAWSELYPYLGKSAIAGALKRLEDGGYVKSGNFNQNPYDRTKWYAITEKGLSLIGQSISRKSEMEERKNENPNDENREPIPNTEQLQDKSKADTLKAATAEIIAYLNAKTGKRFQSNNKQTQEHVSARLSDGYTVEDFKRVIDNKCATWLGDEKMDAFLNPQTLFRPSHFDCYLNERPNAGRGVRVATPYDNLW